MPQLTRCACDAVGVQGLRWSLQKWNSPLLEEGHSAGSPGTPCASLWARAPSDCLTWVAFRRPRQDSGPLL